MEQHHEQSSVAADSLKSKLVTVLGRAHSAGADAAEASLRHGQMLNVVVRNQQTDQLEYEVEQSAGITVYRGGRSGSVGTTDLSMAGLETALEQALTIARFTESDPYAGLADAALMAEDWPELSLYHPWHVDADAAGALGRELETAALEHDQRIAQVEQAQVISGESLSVYGNSHGFVGATRASRHAMSCAAIARDSVGMQGDAAMTQAHAAEDLYAPSEVGALAAQRAVASLDARTPPTTTAPVVFTPRVARSLWGHLVGAISGGALYRDASFLKGCVGQPILAPTVNVQQCPHRPRGLASAGFDGDGVATRQRQLVAGGVLQGYLLSAYSARRLGLQTTGNAGGVFNLEVAPGTDDLAGLLRNMGRGLVVTQLMGQGVSLVTGDYSRGVAGYWVENGEFAYAVENVTIAGNLADMFMQIEAIGNDVDTQAAILTPSLCIGRMTIAGR